MFRNTKTNLLSDVARAYSERTLNNSCEFSGIVSSFLLQKHLIRDIHKYYVLQMILAAQLYIFAIYSSGYFIFEKLGQERHDDFMQIMHDYYIKNATRRVAAFLAEYEPQITDEMVKPIVDNFIEWNNSATRALRIKSNDYRDISSALFTEIFMDSFLASNGYDALVALDKEKREELSSTIRDMVNSFGREFQQDVIARVSTLNGSPAKES